MWAKIFEKIFFWEININLQKLGKPGKKMKSQIHKKIKKFNGNFELQNAKKVYNKIMEINKSNFKKLIWKFEKIQEW
jgi:hypothetical protein